MTCRNCLVIHRIWIFLMMHRFVSVLFFVCSFRYNSALKLSFLSGAVVWVRVWVWVLGLLSFIVMRACVRARVDPSRRLG